MRVLIVGHSSIVARRALPALLRIAKIEAVDIASRRPISGASLPDNWQGQIYNSYQEAVAGSQAEVAYISLVNSLHEEWAEVALRSGKHVIVDKPAFLSLAAAERLTELADQNGLCLAEALVFSYHPQMEALHSLLSENSGATRAIAVFSIPPLPKENFRNYPELGGGSLHDLGPYAAAVSRIFFGDAPESVVCHVASQHPETKVDTAFSVLACYSGGRSYVGHFGFDTEYQNRLTLIGPDLAVTVDRIFTTPPDLENQLVINRGSQQSSVPVKAGDSFERFFAQVIGGIEKKCRSVFGENLLRDAQTLEAMRASALAESRR